MVRVQNGVVTETRLPRRGRLQDGRSVSNYHLLDQDVLAAEGWRPLTEVKPEHNPETEHLVFSHYDVGEEAVTAVFVVQPIPGEPE